VKLTMLAITLLVLMGTAMCQEPVNHAVSQPTAHQVYVTQPAAPSTPAASQPAAPVPYFAFQPMVNIPHVRHTGSPEDSLVHQPALGANQPLMQPTATPSTRTCGCGL
jgi:hypothetical protein